MMTPERIRALRTVNFSISRSLKHSNLWEIDNLGAVSEMFYGLREALDETDFLKGRVAFLEQLMNSAVDTVVRVKTLPVQVYDHGRMAPGDKYVEWSAVREALGNDDPEIVR
jgi:hypothetical protein